MTTKSNTAMTTIRTYAKTHDGKVPASVIAKAHKLNPKVARERLRRAVRSKEVTVQEDGRFYAVPVAQAARVAKIMQGAAA